jgi:hypothetical protein
LALHLDHLNPFLTLTSGQQIVAYAVLQSEKSEICDPEIWNNYHPRDILVATESLLLHHLLDQLANAVGLMGNVGQSAPQPLTDTVPRQVHRVCNNIITLYKYYN